MNNRHKYFRNLRYKQKLETRYDNSGCNSGVYFITHEVDPRYIREHKAWFQAHVHYYLNLSEFDKANGRHYYRYWDRPEVTYSIVKHSWGRNGWKKLMKYQTARRNRRIKIAEDDVAVREKGFYKKVEDIWNYD